MNMYDLIRAAVIGTSIALSSHAIGIEQEQVIFYHNDALGSPVAATDKEGKVLWREQYTPFGSRLNYQSRETDCSGEACLPVESAWDEKQWYTGKLEETRTGLQYFGARWYEPELGRFISPDPIEFRERNAFSFNRYAYANNNPYKYIDPDGKDTISITGTIHVPGSILHMFGVSEVPVSGFTGGIAFSFPGIWGSGGDYDFGVIGGVDVPILDAGLGKASIDVGYSKGSLSELAGDSIELSTTMGSFNGGINWDSDSQTLTGIKMGRGVALGRLSRSLQDLAGTLKNPELRNLVDQLLRNNLSVTYQLSKTSSLVKSDKPSQNKKVSPSKDE